MPIHIRAEAGAVAPAAILVGDPLRAARAAAMLDSPTIYNERRGLLGVTGSWRGHRLTVQTTGMGGPTAAIVTGTMGRPAGGGEKAGVISVNL